MEQSYEARRENLRRRKKSKSSNYSGKFLPLLSEIVALRFLRIHPLTTLPFTLPSRGDKRNRDPPIPPSHGSFLKMIVIYAIVSSELLLTSAANSLDLGGSQNIRTYCIFRSGTRSLEGGWKFILARLHFGEYLALASLRISD